MVFFSTQPGRSHLVLAQYLRGPLPESVRDLQKYESGERGFTLVHLFTIDPEDFALLLSRNSLASIEPFADQEMNKESRRRWMRRLTRRGVANPGQLGTPIVVYSGRNTTDSTFCSLITDTNLLRVYVYCSGY